MISRSNPPSKVTLEFGLQVEGKTVIPLLTKDSAQAGGGAQRAGLRGAGGWAVGRGAWWWVVSSETQMQGFT